MEVIEQLNPEMVVPFEGVDGLSLEELADYPNLLFRGRYLLFMMYDSLSLCKRDIGYCLNFTEKEEKVMARYFAVIDTEKDKDRTIDDVVEY